MFLPIPRNSCTTGTPIFPRCSGSPTADNCNICGQPKDYLTFVHCIILRSEPSADQLALRGYRMAAILLTGAGFSFNWGGKLAKELNTAIMMKVQDDPQLVNLLRRNPNFEEALTELQNAAATSTRPDVKERLYRLETVIVEVFAVMNKNMA